MQAFIDYLEKRPVVNQVIKLLITILIVIVAVTIILHLSKKLFQKLRDKKTGFNMQFGEKVFRFLVIFIGVLWVIMGNDLTKSFGQSLLQSTAVIAAIAGFAAQSVLADMICGIIINSTKPFNIGDRIELENGIGGIVKDMTLRHVVLQGIDTQVFIVPNSKMNAQSLKNMSYQSEIRSFDFKFSISYDSDPEYAGKIIRQAIIDSPLSVPGKRSAGEKGLEYAQVYFLAFQESSLSMGTTAYYKPGTPTEVFRNDINTRVKKALESNGIEIPYNYLNVKVSQKGTLQE